MEETERRTESITVRLISKEQFCEIMDAIYEQDKLMDSICKSLERIADIFSFDVDNRYRKALEDPYPRPYGLGKDDYRITVV